MIFHWQVLSIFFYESDLLITYQATAMCMLIELAERAFHAKGWSTVQAAEDARRLVLNRLFRKTLFLINAMDVGDWKPKVRHDLPKD